MMLDYKEINEHSSFELVSLSIKTLLLEFIKNPSSLDFYVHPLGFYYCRIINGAENQLRLHLWPYGYHMKEDLFIHDHFYDLTSWVLNGSIEDFTYSVKAATSSSPYALFKSAYLNGNDIRTIRRTNEFQDVNIVKTRFVETGVRYNIEKGTFHSNRVIVQPESVAVTCVYTYNHNSEMTPRVIGLWDQVEFEETIPDKLSTTDVVALCTLVLNILDNKTKFPK